MNRQAYPSDLSNSEWSIIEPLLPTVKKYGRGRKQQTDQREIVNAILYLLKEGCQWRSRCRVIFPTGLPLELILTAGEEKKLGRD